MTMKRPGHISLFFILLIGAIIAAVSCDNAGRSPTVIVPVIVAALPHDSAAFTQGLFYDGGRLYESDGLYEKSALRMLDAQNGALLKRIPLDSRSFGEGCAKMGETIVQITWREQTAFTYSLADLSLGSTLVYSGEGWGLTSDGSLFYMSDGSDTIAVRNKNFTIVRKIAVALEGRPARKLNELEYVKGKIYANSWYSDSILEINPNSGRVERIIDCSGIVKQEQPNSPECVLNGIAYNSATQHFYLTGKKWKKIFVVELLNK